MSKSIMKKHTAKTKQPVKCLLLLVLEVIHLPEQYNMTAIGLYTHQGTSVRFKLFLPMMDPSMLVQHL